MARARASSLRYTLAVGISLVVGLLLAGYYAAYLHRESLRDWRVLRVTFKNLGGLREKSAVMVNGHAMGRVREVRFFEDRQLVVLDLEPKLRLYKEDRFEIVPTSALGFVGVEVSQAPPEERTELLPDDPELIVEGHIRAALGGGPPTPGRRKELKGLIDDMVGYTEQLTRADGGLVGGLAFDHDQLDELRGGLAALEQTWQDLDGGLARIERGASRISSEEYLLAVRATTQAMDDTFRGLRDSLRETMRGDDGLSEFVRDRGYGLAWREALLRQQAFWAGARTETLPDAMAYVVERPQILSAWEERTAAGVRGEGFFGLLSSPEVGDEARGILRGLTDGLEAFEEGPLVHNPQARRQLEDLLGNGDDLLLNMRRGLRGLRRSFSDKDFKGAAFSVF